MSYDPSQIVQQWFGDHFGMYLVLIPEIIAKECKSRKSTVLALGTVATSLQVLLFGQ